MGAEGPLVGPPVFKTDGDGAPVLVCSIRTRPRRLCSTFNAQEVGQLRAALQGAGVEFVIQQDRQNGSFFGIGLQLVPPSVEYIIYVHEDDFELAQAALQGTLN